MESDNGSLGFRITLDNSQVAADAARIKAQLQAIGDTGAASGARLDNAFNQARKSANLFGNDVASLQRNILTLASVSTLGRLGKEIISVRGEFQQLGIAFETMLGSKEKSDRLMAQQIALAQKTPFTLVDVATNTKQLLAMGIGYEKVMQTMKDLGNVAAGVSVPLSRIAINYGQVATLGKLQQREIRDFAMAGIPIIDELAKNLGKAKDEIFGMVEAGQVGFKDVEKAFQTMSGEGGKFYNLMEKQNASVTGQISNLSDKLQIAANEIGQSNEGIIYGSISMATSAIKNYKEIGEAITALVGTYGLYKAATMTVIAMETSRIAVTEAKKAALREELALNEASTLATTRKAEKEAAAETLSATIEAKKQAAALKSIAAMEASEIANSQLIAAEERLAAVKGKQIVITNEVAAVETARANLNKAIALENKALTQETILNEKLERDVIIKANAEKMLSDEAALKLKNEEILKNTVATGAEIRAAQAKKLSAAAQSLLNATMLNNPYVLTAVAIGAVTYGLYKFITYQTELEKATSKMNVEFENERDKVNDLFSALKLTTEGTKEHEAAKKRLIDQYGQYIPEQNKELKNLVDIKTAYDEVNTSLKENLALKTRNELKIKISDEFNPQILKYKGRILGSLTGEQKSDASFILDQFIQQAKTEGLTMDQAIVKRNELLQKLNLMTSDGFIKAGSGQKVASFFYDISESIISMNEATKKVDDSFNKFISDSKKGQVEPTAPISPTVKEQIADLNRSISEGEAKLKEWRSSGSTKSASEIEDLKSEIEGYKKTLETLTGISQKQKEAVDELKIAQDELEKAVKSGNRAAIDASAKKIIALEAEKKKLEEIIDLELKRAWRDQFDGQSMTPISSIGKNQIQQIGQTKTVQGILYEITAIDKTGPTWTKVKAQYSELKKFEKKTNEDAAKKQEDLDKEVADKKKETQQQILDGATRFTDQLIEQLGLSEQQTAQMKEMVSVIGSVASGNWIGAIFQAASMVVGTLKEETVSFLDVTNQQISKTNDLLSLHSKILSGLTGDDYFKASAAEIKKINLELDSYKKKLSDILVVDTRSHRKIDTSNWDSSAWLNALDNPIYGINGGKEATAAILGQIADLEAKKAALIDEMYQKILGFGASDVSDSIFKGIEDGLKLGQNSLGGFAQSFGDLMKKALMQAIVDSTNTEITTNFLPKVKEFLQNDEVGPNGEQLSPREQLLLEGIYSSIVKGGQEQQAATKYITDKYGTSTDSRTGSSRGIATASQDSVDELNGRFTAIQSHTFSMSQGVSILVSNSNLILKSVQGIEKNTMSLSRLEAIENNIASVKNGIDTINLKGITLK